VVARPDRHLLVDGDRVVLAHSARVNGHRPAIDPLLESASRSFGPRVLGILLSGTLDDGVVGLGDIRAAGGVTAVQDPTEAAYPGMPTAALEAGVVDHSLPLVDLVELIGSLTTGASGPLVPEPAGGATGPGEPELTLAALSCPNCGGSLWHADRPGGEQYECRVGHRYSPTSLFQIQGDKLDDALWTAHRALLERADLARRMARRMRRSNLPESAARYDRTVGESEESAAALLQALTAKAEHEPHGDEPGTRHVGRN
jgi:two-component system, chemotaxis family, protein-glutamate methylesterase/glutaminase